MSTSPPSRTKYAHLSQEDIPFDDGNEAGHEKPAQHPERKRRPLGILMKFAVIILAIFGTIDLLRLATISTLRFSESRAAVVSLSDSGYLSMPHQRSCRCGSTIDEAKANSCVYDSMAAAWLPPHCIDFELLREWETAGDGPGGRWEYFADQHRQHPLTVDEVANLPLRHDVENTFFVSMAWHVKHCAFAWRKEYRSAATGVTVDRRSSGLHHIAHCEMMFLKRNALSDLVTRVGVVMDADEGEEDLE